MRYLATSVLLLLSTLPGFAKVVIFWQSGFPTVGSEPISRPALEGALKGEEQVYIGSDALKQPTTLAGTDLLVLPYGSAFPAEGWQSIIAFLRRGGNLLVLGGQPFRVPISAVNGSFVEGQPQDS